MKMEATQTFSGIVYDPGFFQEKIGQARKWLVQNGEDFGSGGLADPCRIDLRMLVRDGVLRPEEWSCMSLTGDEEADPEELRQNQEILLTMAYERSNVSQDPAFQRFVQENQHWLEEYALFLALDHFFGGICWQQWPEDIRRRYGYALDHYRRELYFDREFQMYLQFLCFRQQMLSKTDTSLG